MGMILVVKPAPLRCGGGTMDNSNSKRQQQAAAAVRRAHTPAGIVKISATEG
jgi:hypothetical protein